MVIHCCDVANAVTANDNALLATAPVDAIDAVIDVYVDCKPVMVAPCMLANACKFVRCN
jgi:hypothetical protein